LSGPGATGLGRSQFSVTRVKLDVASSPRRGMGPSVSPESTRGATGRQPLRSPLSRPGAASPSRVSPRPTAPWCRGEPLGPLVIVPVLARVPCGTGEGKCRGRWRSVVTRTPGMSGSRLMRPVLLVAMLEAGAVDVHRSRAMQRLREIRASEEFASLPDDLQERICQFVSPDDHMDL